MMLLKLNDARTHGPAATCGNTYLAANGSSWHRPAQAAMGRCGRPQAGTGAHRRAQRGSFSGPVAPGSGAGRFEAGAQPGGLHLRRSGVAVTLLRVSISSETRSQMISKSHRKRNSFAARRSRALRQAGAQAGVDVLLVSQRQDVSYLTGFSGEDSYVALHGGGACLITDGRFDEQAGRECGRIDIHVRTGAMSAAVAEVVRPWRRGKMTVGVQGDHMTIVGREQLAKALRCVRLVSVSGVLRQLRLVKDDSEVRAIRKAVGVAERAMRELLAQGAGAFVGRSERQVAAELEYRMRLAGADGPAFDTIVAAGANGSLPHYRPAGATIRRGQGVLIDWGALVGGYVSDLTRVVLVGKIPPKLAKVYEVVLRSQAKAIAAVRPGVGCRSVDAAAREAIARAGYGSQFVHGLGHGIGREVHESPALARLAGGRLRKNMVVTIEPGIYLPGIGGIRIEDDVLVTTSGAKRLGTLPRSPAAMTVR